MLDFLFQIPHLYVETPNDDFLLPLILDKQYHWFSCFINFFLTVGLSIVIKVSMVVITFFKYSCLYKDNSMCWTWTLMSPNPWILVEGFVVTCVCGFWVVWICNPLIELITSCLILMYLKKKCVFKDKWKNN